MCPDPCVDSVTTEQDDLVTVDATLVCDLVNEDATAFDSKAASDLTSKSKATEDEGSKSKGDSTGITGEPTSITETMLRMGWRFVPTDEELVLSYLSNKVAQRSLPANIINEIDASEFYNKHPKDLALNMEADEETTRSEYFFIKNDKYFHGKVEKQQAVGDGKIGSWRFAGKEETINGSDRKNIACKIHSTFFSTTRKTEWNMELYRLTNIDQQELPIEEWVVARVTGGLRNLPN